MSPLYEISFEKGTPTLNHNCQTIWPYSTPVIFLFSEIKARLIRCNYCKEKVDSETLEKLEALDFALERLEGFLPLGSSKRHLRFANQYYSSI